MSESQVFKSILLLSLFITLLILLKENLNKCDNKYLQDITIPIKPLKKFIYIGKKQSMENAWNVLERLGYKNDNETTEWDLMWICHAIKYELDKIVSVFKPFQLINYIFFHNGITKKFLLNKKINANESFVMPCFSFPRDNESFEAYQKENPNSKFVTKSFNHRHIALIDKFSDINQTHVFLQRFMDNPLLVGGHKFEMGIYTFFTSVNPLRVYIYNGEIALRFCPKPYHPFDPNDLEKYVVNNGYQPIYETPEIADFYEAGYGMRSSLIGYFKRKGIDINTIFEQAENIIRTTIRNGVFDPSIEYFKKKYNFFEMFRFDFLIDENLKVFLLEANYIPNMNHNQQPKNRLLFEQILYHLFSLVGAAPRIKKNTLALTYDETQVMASDRNTAVYVDLCSKHCIENCNHQICRICHTCMRRDKKDILLRAYMEHVNKMDCKRIFPPEMHPTYQIPNNLPNIDKWMYTWYLGKCIEDKSWCKG